MVDTVATTATVAMQMTGANGTFSVPSEHLPGLVVLVLVMPVLWVALSGLRALARHEWAQRLLARYDHLTFTAKAVLFASLVGALVHAAIVPTHWGDERVTALLFVVDAIGFALTFWWTFTSRPHWRALSVAMLGGTAGAYALYILTGWETMDLVGLLTTTIELAAALVVLSPVLTPRPADSPTGEYRLALAAIPVALVTLLGTGAIASADGPATTTAAAGATATSTTMPSMPSMSSAGSDHALSLATTSPAGPISWPDDMAAMGPGMKMATPNCTTHPSTAQQQAAVTLVNQTVSAATPYRSLAAAKAAGYVPVTPSGKKIVHYINPSIYRQGEALTPSSIPVLVYANTAHGAVLLAAMYLMPERSAGAPPPQPGGCLTQWHIHTNLCFSAGKVVGTDSGATCAPGSANAVTQPMMHVWMTPVAGGPLAPDPSNRSEVLSALQMPTLNPPNGTA
ncbi:MAG TPA: hypothetical protein VG298_17215 [Acidimicrobiales bacterium]|jgi:hypothetical protein|nr:hypothetical protein [Acidimicrobiales bacterium]